MAESIYSWVVAPAAVPARPPAHVSKHDGSAAPRTTLVDPLAITSTAGSIGRDMRGTVSPQRYLRAHEAAGAQLAARASAAATAAASGRRRQRHRKPPLPPAASPSAPGDGTGRDFVTENALAAMLGAVAGPASTRRLHRAPHDAPDAAPGGSWLNREGFGAVPEYLSRIKQRVAAEQHAAARSAEAALAAAEALQGRRLGGDERRALLDALKARWDEVTRQYQLVTHKKISTATSTVSEIRYKEQCERELAALEGDIGKLQADGPIFVLSE